MSSSTICELDLYGWNAESVAGTISVAITGFRFPGGNCSPHRFLSWKGRIGQRSEVDNSVVDRLVASIEHERLPSTSVTTRLRPSEDAVRRPAIGNLGSPPPVSKFVS